MVYAGAVAVGAFPGSKVTLFGWEIESTAWAYVAIALAGTIGYTLGAVAGWAIGRYGGRPYLERHGRWLHITPEKLDRADAWFERYGDPTVFFSRMVPVVRSFVSIPAGIGEMPLVRYTVFTFAGTIPWCFGLAAIGVAAGSQWERVPRGLPLRRLRHRRARRRGRRGRRLPGVPSPSAAPCGGSVRGGHRPVDWPAVAIPLVDVRAQYLPLLDELKERLAAVLESGRFILGPEVARLRGGDRLVPRRPGGDRRRQRDGRAGPRARGARRRARRRGRLPGVHVLRDRGGGVPRGRHARLLRHRRDLAQPRPGRRRRARHPADEGDRRGPPVRPPGARRPPARGRPVHRGHRPGLRREHGEPSGGLGGRRRPRSASSRRRTSSGSATGGSSPRTTPTPPSACGSSASTAPATRRPSRPSA